MKDPECIKQITMRKGFTLAEVRKIRKQIRNIFEMPSQHQYLRWEVRSILLAFYWIRTPQGDVYWHHIYDRILKEQR